MAVGRVASCLLQLLSLLAASLSVAVALDTTLNEGAVGSEVVQAVIAKLDASRVAFRDDHRMLRRLAFVETVDGTNSTSGDRGGLWGLDEAKLDTVLSSPELLELRIALGAIFGIDWGSVTIDDLLKPFYAGVVARLYLHYLEISGTAVIPLAGDLVAQARFWLAYYHSNVGGVSRTEVYFVDQVDILEEREGCKVNLDIFFVLDGSGSIGSTDFSQVRQFEHDFVEQLRVGPQDNQVGTIVFSTASEVVFYLNTYNNSSDVLNQILAIPYPGGSTNTADGLCKLVRYGFADGNGARPASGAVFRIAIVMTDGKSNQESSECQWNTLQAAEAVHKLDPPVLVYVIGVTDSVNVNELNAIASSHASDPDSKFVTYIDSFDPHDIQEVQESHADEVCKRATLPADTGEEMNGTLDQNETVRYHFQVPVAGITVRVCITVGHVVVYGSFTVPNPNSAFYDFSLEFETEPSGNKTETCKNKFISPDKIPPPPDIPTTTSTATPPSTQNMQSSIDTLKTSSVSTPQPTVVPSVGPDTQDLTDKIVYLSVVGRAGENNFVLNGSVGDTYPEPPDVISTTTTPTVSTTITVSTTTKVILPTTPSASATDGDLLFIIVVSSGAGSFLIVSLLCVFLCTCICCCICSRRRSKSVRIDQYKLLPKDKDADMDVV